MSTVLVVAEQHDGALRKTSLSSLNAGKQLAEATGGKWHTLLLGAEIGPVATELAAYGGEAVHVADSAELRHDLAEPCSQVIAQVAQQIAADIVLAAATTTGKDILPRVAAKLEAGMASDVLSFETQGGSLVFRRPMWAGSVLADVSIETPCKVLTIRASAFSHAEKAAAPSPIQPVAVQIDAAKVHARFVELRQVKSARPDLGDARIIVSGGRGTKGDFKPIEELADALGAAIGASRAAADAGWVPSDYQVGQTGKTVAPDLYIAIGISGAIQHVAGMKNSKIIVAINKDPDAPIFQIADYGLVGDLFKILPELQAALAKH
jgi:electron transfer flavoprotein alpha subunit